MMNIIGLVGPIACGKGVVADYLIQEYGYTSFSLSTIVHDELKKRGITQFTRTTMQNIGDELRKKEGDGVLARRAIEQLTVNSQQSTDFNLKLKTQNLQNKKLQVSSYKFQKRIIIEGIRNPGEVEYLRTIPGFYLIAVDAPQKLRFERVLQRGKPWDPVDWESFLVVDGRDKEDATNVNGQQVRKCMDMADVKIENTGDILQIQKEVETHCNASLQRDNSILHNKRCCI
jgi:dephospho-CoA kinase